MNENEKKKREWVKTAAIVFLAVMLVLTFFSNTIMNYSLPEVATQYVQSGTITAKVRGSGVVESGDPYNVMVTGTRKVSSVAVKTGDTVQPGDVILYLADEESDELKTAQEELEAAKDALQAARDAYDLALLTKGYSEADILAANSNVSATVYRQQLTDAQNAVKPLQAKVDELTQWIADIDAQLEYEGRFDEKLEDANARYTQAQTALQTAQTALDTAKKEEEAAKKKYEQEHSVSENSVSTGNAKGDWNDKAAALKSAQETVKNRQAEFEAAQKAYYTAKESTTDDTYLLDQKALAGVNLYNAQKELTAAQKQVDDLTAMLTNMLDLDTYQRDVSQAQREVNEAQAKVNEELQKSSGATVTADIAGTVTSINVTAGETTSAADPVAVLQPEGAGYSLSFSVTNEQARRLAVGDRADLVNAWRYDDVEVTLSAIRPDKSDPGQKKLLIFNVTGDVVAGQTFNVSVGQQSANFDFIVPNSAVREDNNGKFILIVESRSTPLGNRYRAVRVDVEVLASDDSQSALSSGTLQGYEFVITTSTQPVEAGQLVRLANE